jgi:hypothetical protein
VLDLETTVVTGLGVTQVHFVVTATRSDFDGLGFGIFAGVAAHPANQRGIVLFSPEAGKDFLDGAVVSAFHFEGFQALEQFHRANHAGPRYSSVFMAIFGSFNSRHSPMKLTPSKKVLNLRSVRGSAAIVLSPDG